MISLDQLEAMFENIRQGAGWDMSQPMLWGYFFTDKSREKLESLMPLLEREGYRFVDLFVPELDEGEEPYFFLHVEKAEVHSPHSLHQRNAALYALAERYAVDSYDGMDVGPLTDRG
ncbi:MAG: ribonuclease E inhibitor RraB [Lysobacteraceae bacterium]|nr:MAG: ribonuclease E inhibitor RraB [Xanthomonadaceae bacterium]